MTDVLQPGVAPYRLKLPEREHREHCRQIVRDHSQTFYIGSRFFPQRQRIAVWAVYAACRIGDDLADDPRSGTLAIRTAALADWWQNIEAVYSGDDDLAPVWMALRWAVQTYSIPLAAFAELYQGFLMDLNETVYSTVDDLDLYCRRVAGVVGLMIAPICGYSGGDQTLACALRLGQAMQMTNILRDVGADLSLGRLYLPTDLVAEFGLDISQLRNGELSPNYIALIQMLIGRARDWYREGEQGLSYLHGAGRFGVAIAARAYEGILDDLERNGYNNLSRRPFVAFHRKLALIPGIWWQLA